MTETVLDLSQSRKTRTERCERFRTAANDLLLMLEQQRPYISEDFMAFLLAMAVSDQALQYARQADNRQAGLNFLDSVQLTARQIFETHFQPDTRRQAAGTPAAAQVFKLFGGHPAPRDPQQPPSGMPG